MPPDNPGAGPNSLETTSDRPIADQVAALQRDSAGHLPPEVAAVFAAHSARLESTPAPDDVAPLGSAMPDGELIDVQGRPTTLDALRAGKASVVVLYRGAWCPYCNLTLRTYQDVLVPELDARDVSLIAISPQKPDGSLTMQQKHDLTYVVVSDPGNQIARQLGVLTEPPEDVRIAEVALGLDVAAINADGTPGIPMPTVVIVDAGGTIRWIDVHPNHTTRTEPAEILAALDAAAERDASESAKTA